MVDLQRFQQFVQKAYAHLYDYSYLQTHPLGVMLVEDSLIESRGRALFGLLIATIDQLKPPQSTPATSSAWRKYNSLFRRYIEGIPPNQIAEDLGVTSRQYRRYHSEAIEAVANILYTTCQSAENNIRKPKQASSLDSGFSITGGDSERKKADDIVLETEKLLLAAGVLTIVSHLGQSQGITLSLALPPDFSPASIDPAVLRPLLLGLLGHAIDSLVGSDVKILVSHRDNSIIVSTCALSEAAISGADVSDLFAGSHRRPDVQGGQPATDSAIPL